MNVQARQVVETSSGWLLEVNAIQWWSDDDGAVYGRAFNRGRWSPEKYLGTVRGIRELAVSRLRIVR
jgi:hypothetical protein